ncbi:MAG: type II secretion system F family protein [Planctomycetia bacterium]|nr:type II secretion system F family protein [Planctomycetia bacterium]
MASAAGQPPKTLTLEELSALGDEMAALVRAGVPLEAGLAQLAGDLPGRLARSVDTLSARLASGQSLADAIGDSPELFPPVYAAVVEAGARSGRLAAALEALTATARRVTELREIAIASLIYPLLTFLVGYVVLALYVWQVAPQYLRMFIDLHATPPWGVNALIWLGTFSAGWWLVPIVLLLVVGSWWWFYSARSAMLSGRSGWATLWLPPIRRVLESSRWATIVDLLAMLVEHGVPLPQAVRLAVDAGGDARLRQSAQAVAVRMEQGGALDAKELTLEGWPPLLRWSLLSASRRSGLLASLRFAADHYRRQAQDNVQWLRTCLPVAAALVLGGAVIVFVIVVVLGPWLKLLTELVHATVV